MADKTDSLDGGPTNNGNGDSLSIKEKMNGKRDAESMDTVPDGVPAMKKTKGYHNGVSHSPNSENEPRSKSPIHNGSKDNDSDSPATPMATEDPASDKKSDVLNLSTKENRAVEPNSNTGNQLREVPDTDNDNNGLDLKIKCDKTSQPDKSHQDKSQVIKEESIAIKMEVSEEMDKPSQHTPGPASEDPEPEIITLSDSEDEFQEVLLQAMSVTSSASTRCKLLRMYQDQLRAEESKLILLRKLKQSLSRPMSASATGDASGKISAADMRTQVSSQKGGNAPPPLKHRGHQQQGLSNHHLQQHKIVSSHHQQGDVMKGAHQSNGPSSGGPPPLVNMAKTPPHLSSSNQANGISGYNQYQQHSVVSQPKKSAPPPPPKPTAEQKMAAAKIALKKQLEQALQQISAPKPPPPEVNFLPSLASGEFVYLIGMEEVVKQLLSTEQKDVKFVFNPFSCVQCETDFTPVWKRDKPGSKNVICEKCITTNQKRMLKKEHTSKLKSVFAKSLQKQQEIERRIANGSPLADIPGLNVLAAQVNITPSRSHQSNAAATASSNTPSMPQLTAQHNTSSSPSAGGQISQSQMQQHQAMLHAQAAEQMRAMLAAQAMASLPYQMYGVTNKQAADLQRQYLLDMINPNRSWKT